ncbi:Re/Si-specific NAD(P)(+) transhydrogenase subunit alpha [bacterium]|nr:Re/Si-specific NAD(P)(+) transhydrogenase subunit alpha [bacterium]
MKVGVLKEIREGENRVAATPDSIKKLLPKGVEVLVETGAGDHCSISDPLYEAAGAKVVSREEAAAADIVLKVQCPLEEELSLLKEGTLLITMIDPFGDGPDIMDKLAAAKVNCFGMELVPRITRAQVMDVLSSQANVGGYKAVLEAAHHYTKMFPMLMTAAGSVPPSKCMILGVGVAGLQAIATARRLGAQVEAFDVRPEVKEQILSLGAKFLELGIDESGSGSGGYAKELSEESKQKQKDALTRELARADIVITTALIPGRPAPELVTEEAVKNMKEGSVIVDMAAARGGNCPLSEADKVVVKHGVTLIGHTNLPSMVPNHSSLFFARNLVSTLELFLKKEEDKTTLTVDFEDEIVDAAMVCYDGKRRWPKQES